MAFIASCSVFGSENNNVEIRYVVKDYSADPVDKQITYTHGHTGELVVVVDNTDHWERTFEFTPKRDARLSAAVLTDDLIKMGIYIYKNGELVESEEYNQVHSLSLTCLN